MTDQLTNLQKDRILRDLAEKFPIGPKRTLRKCDYRIVEKWVSEYERFDVKWVTLEPSQAASRKLDPTTAETYGYDDVTLYRLGLRSESDAKVWATKFWSGRAVARRGRLVWARIRPALERVKRQGTAGIWRVMSYDVHYNHPVRQGLFVHAETREHALAQFAVVASMLGVGPGADLRAHFVDMGDHRQAAERNIRRLNSPVRDAQQQVETMKRRLARAEEDLAAAQALTGKCVSAVMLLGTAEHEEDPADAAE